MYNLLVLSLFFMIEGQGAVQSVSGRGRHITDAELDRQIFTWANQRLEAAGKRRRISSFYDSSLSSGLPLVRGDQSTALLFSASLFSAWICVCRSERESPPHCALSIAASLMYGHPIM